MSDIPKCFYPYPMQSYIGSITQRKYNNLCENCPLKDEEKDMGKTIPLCKKFTDYTLSINAREGRIDCNNPQTWNINTFCCGLENNK